MLKLGLARLFILITAIAFLQTVAHLPHAFAQTNQEWSLPMIRQAAVKHASELYQTCPPEKCFILNFGMTAAIASAYFRAKIPDPEARAHYTTELMANGFSEFNARSRESKENAFRIFDKILPSAETLNGRPIIIHRVVWAGHTMAGLIRALKAYHRERRPDLKVGAYLIVGPGFRYNYGDEFPTLSPLWTKEDLTYRGQMIDFVDSDVDRSHIDLLQYAETRRFDLTAPPDEIGRKKTGQMELEEADLDTSKWSFTRVKRKLAACASYLLPL